MSNKKQQDSVHVELPVSGGTVSIRGYTTHRDDKASNSAMSKHVDVEFNDKGKGIFKPTMEALEASQEAYVYRLVDEVKYPETKAVSERDAIIEALEDMHSADYEAVDEAVNKVVEENSPKAKRQSESASSG